MFDDGSRRPPRIKIKGRSGHDEATIDLRRAYPGPTIRTREVRPPGSGAERVRSRVGTSINPLSIGPE
jgi:hypothetical protein